MDALQILIDVARNLEEAGIRLVLALAVAAGFGGVTMTLIKQTARVRTGRRASGYQVLVALCMGGALISLTQVMNLTAHSLAFGDVSYSAIAYAPDSMGEAGEGIDAVLTLLRWVGFCFFLVGVLRMRRSMVDGHSGLSAREDVGNGGVMTIAGILLACNPELLDTLQNTFHLGW